ncbi:MAG: FadR/GntR family transcriptional regulator [Asticcacaulis sp.]
MRSKMGVSLAYGLLTTLGQSIVTGEFETTGFPTEAELCVRYGASRTVMREAVKMLSAKGLISSRQRQGTRVEPVENWNLLDPDVLKWLMERPFSNKIYLEFTQMRLAIEPAASALAAQVQDRPAIAAIRDGLNKMMVHAGDPEKSLLADIEFHVAILKASGNPFFWRLKPLISNALRMSIQLTNKIAGHTASIDDHDAIVSAIERGDAQTAESASRYLLIEALDVIGKAEKAG